MTRRLSASALFLLIVVVAITSFAATSTVVLTVDGMT